MSSHFVGWLKANEGPWRPVCGAADYWACWDVLLSARGYRGCAEKMVLRAGLVPWLVMERKTRKVR